MKISDMISKLQALQAEHGDLPVLVAGFDSSGYDDPLDDPRVESVQKIANPGSHSPRYEEADSHWFPDHYTPEGDPFLAVYLG